MMLLDLDNDLLANIFAHLDGQGICRAASVCTILHAVETSCRDRIWKAIALAAKLDEQMVFMAGLSWKALVALERASHTRSKSSLQSMEQEFEFLAIVRGSCNCGIPCATRECHTHTPFVIPLMLNEDEEVYAERRDGVGMSTPDSWDGPPPNNDWISADLEVYVRNKREMTIAKLLVTRIYDLIEEPEDNIWFEFVGCEFVHADGDTQCIEASVCVTHVPGDMTKWTSVSLSNLHIQHHVPYDVPRGDNVPFTLSQFSDKLTSGTVIWTPCSL